MTPFYENKNSEKTRLSKGKSIQKNRFPTFSAPNSQPFSRFEVLELKIFGKFW